MDEIEYIIERRKHGWLLKAPVGRVGVPISAIEEVGKIAPKGSVVDASIARFYTIEMQSPVAFAFAGAKDLQIWRRAIEGYLDGLGLSPEMRWWRGLDVGESSAAMFGVLASNPSLREEVGQSGRCPLDSGDFDRCKKLIDRFPGWKDRLHEVAEAYPETSWPAIISAWNDLVEMPPSDQSKFLSDLR